MSRWLPLIAVGAAWIWVAPAAAQPAGHPLGGIHTRETLTEDERNTVRRWVGDQFNAVLSEEAAGSTEALNRLRQAVEGSRAYREVFAAAAAPAVATALSQTRSAATAARLLTIAHLTGEPVVAQVLIDALKDPRPGVRAAAAIGLRALRSRLAGSGELLSRVLQALRDAGAAEASRDTLKAIYRAMHYGEPPGGAEARAALSALLELLEARAAQYARGAVRAAGADEAGLAIIAAQVGSLTNEDRQRLLRVLGTLLQSAIQQYTTTEKLYAVREDAGPQRELRDAMALLIDTGERLLVGLLAPPSAPSVSARMTRAAATDMKTEWRNWAALLRTATGQDYSLDEAAGEQP